MAKAVQLKDKNGNKIFAAPWMPIGSIFLTVSNDNPSKYFGGTWEKISGGFLWGCNTSVDNNLMPDGHTKTFNDGGGNTGSTALNVNQIPKHGHWILALNKNSNGYNYNSDMDYAPQGSKCVVNYATTYNPDERGWGNSVGMQMTGGNQGHNHTYPNHTHDIPHIGVWVWKRIK